MKKILSIISSAIGAVLVSLATIMPFDSKLDMFAPIAMTVGIAFLFLPEVCYWRKKENGAIVAAATIIGIAIILAAIIIATFARINPMG